MKRILTSIFFGLIGVFGVFGGLCLLYGQLAIGCLILGSCLIMGALAIMIMTAPAILRAPERRKANKVSKADRANPLIQFTFKPIGSIYKSPCLVQFAELTNVRDCGDELELFENGMVVRQAGKTKVSLPWTLITRVQDHESSTLLTVSGVNGMLGLGTTSSLKQKILRGKLHGCLPPHIYPNV